MTSISEQRNAWLTAEKKKRATNGKAASLETAMEKIVKTQALLFKMKIE